MSDNCSAVDLSDELLVFAAKSGDAGAFVELHKRHYNKILRTIYRVTKSREDAEDALQDSFLKAYLHLSTFEGRATFSSWLTRIALNSAFMILRKKRSHNEISIEDTNDPSATCGRQEQRKLLEDSELLYIQREREEMVNGAILQLRPDLRNVVELRYEQDCSMTELADCLGISVPAAKSRLLRARSALRASLL
ncbi:MAG: sigma-70 family RNA polymerase sigma factor [Edaphobacter sp.]